MEAHRVVWKKKNRTHPRIFRCLSRRNLLFFLQILLKQSHCTSFTLEYFNPQDLAFISGYNKKSTIWWKWWIKYFLQLMKWPKMYWSSMFINQSQIRFWILRLFLGFFHPAEFLCLEVLMMRGNFSSPWRQTSSQDGTKPKTPRLKSIFFFCGFR